MCMCKCESIWSIPDGVSCVLVKPCSSLSSPPPRLSLACIMARECVWGWMYSEKGWSHVRFVAEKQPGFHHPSLLSFFLSIPIGSVIPQSASQGCHRPMIKPGDRTHRHKHPIHTLLLSCNPLSLKLWCIRRDPPHNWHIFGIIKYLYHLVWNAHR